jgi:hypothetical protein
MKDQKPYVVDKTKKTNKAGELKNVYTIDARKYDGDDVLMEENYYFGGDDYGVRLT